MTNKLKSAPKRFWQSLKSDFRRLFIAGLLVFLPVWLTFLIMRFLIKMTDSALLILPPQWRPEDLFGFHIPGIGIILTVFIILVVGFFARNFLGRRLMNFGESLIESIPLVRNVYSGLRQFTYAILGGKDDQFQHAILLEYPRRGIWTIGFVTNSTDASIMASYVPKDSLCVFIPTTPNPTSGWFLIIPESDTIRLDMSVEEAFKILISGGVVLPENLPGP
jgi:uncharacterized membrane protein